MSELVVDAHQHFWDIGRFTYPWMKPPRDALRRNFLPEDLKPLLAQAGVSRTILVQAQHSLAEARWLLELADANAFIAGVVVWADVTSSQLAKDLDELQRHPRFKGVRHIIEDEPDEVWMVREDVLDGLAELERRGIPYDLLIRPRHLKYVRAIRERCPELCLVVDHLSKPLIAQKKMDGWARDIEALARLPKIWCKLSGMLTEADWKAWTAEDLKPYVEHVVKLFGYDRVMFGSDWPVCTLAGSYQQVADALRQALGPISERDEGRVWGGNARQFYRI